MLLSPVANASAVASPTSPSENNYSNLTRTFLKTIPKSSVLADYSSRQEKFYHTKYKILHHTRAKDSNCHPERNHEIWTSADARNIMVTGGAGFMYVLYSRPCQPQLFNGHSELKIRVIKLAGPKTLLIAVSQCLLVCLIWRWRTQLTTMYSLSTSWTIAQHLIIRGYWRSIPTSPSNMVTLRLLMMLRGAWGSIKLTQFLISRHNHMPTFVLATPTSLPTLTSTVPMFS